MERCGEVKMAGGIDLRCPRCGEDLGLEDDLLDDGSALRLRCSSCGRWIMVEAVRRIEVVDLGDYDEMMMWLWRRTSRQKED